MIQCTRSIFERGGNVVFLKIWVVAQYLRPACAASQQVEDIGNAYALPANARSPAKNLRIGCNSIEASLHGGISIFD